MQAQRKFDIDATVPAGRPAPKPLDTVDFDYDPPLDARAGNPVHRMHADLNRQFGAAPAKRGFSVVTAVSGVAAASLLLPVFTVAFGCRLLFSATARVMPRLRAGADEHRLPHRLAQVSHAIEEASLEAIAASVAGARQRPLAD